MEDRLYRGFVAGAIGGVVATVLGQFSYFLGLNTLRASDWAGILMYAHVPPFSVGEQLFALFIVIGWCGAIGSVFAYFLLWVGSRRILFRAWMFGTTPYFVVYLLTTLFQIPGTVPVPLYTALSNYITSTVFSIVMGYSFQALDPETAQSYNPLKLLAQPTAKHIDKDKSQPHHDED